LKSNATIIEVTHRATSGLALVLVFALMVWVLRTAPRGHRARRNAIASSIFVIGEALIGAGLVLFELVAHNASMKRGLSMILHLENTFLLLAALTLTAWTLQSDVEKSASSRAPASMRALVFGTLAAVLVLGASGAIAALGDTLFPAASLREGLAQDLSPLAHLFQRLRMFHPFIALGTGVIAFASASVVRLARPSPRVRRFARLVTLTFATQFAVGLVNVSLLAPVPLQIVHLLLADLTWIALVLMGWEALYSRSPMTAQSPIMSRNGPAPISEVPPSTSNVDPVTYAAAGDTRNSTVPAISSIDA
jgi:heme A synthase